MRLHYCNWVIRLEGNGSYVHPGWQCAALGYRGRDSVIVRQTCFRRKKYRNRSQPIALAYLVFDCRSSILVGNAVWCAHVAVLARRQPRVITYSSSSFLLTFAPIWPSKWLFQLINENDICQTLLRSKYLKNTTIGTVKRKPEHSQFWSGLMKVKEHFLRHGHSEWTMRNKLSSGKINGWVTIRFKQKFSSLYSTVQKNCYSWVSSGNCTSGCILS
jgi:hypothetical protein